MSHPPNRRIVPYEPALNRLARTLRRNSTIPEKRLWHHLRRKQMLGFSFYRQRPVDRFIVDFLCPDLMLAIEVDGRSHEGTGDADRARQQRLEALGIRFLRFSHDDVMHDLDNVLHAIEGWIRDHAPPPS